MKNIISVFKYDLKDIAKNIIVFVVIIGIAILPALYSWFNIAANWDPYSNTDSLPFAFCTLDKGYNYKSLTVNAGDTIVDNLKKNKKMDWAFVDRKEAINGVKNGKYYAAVVVPKNFSKNLFSVTTGNFKQAKLQYYVNEKSNAIAPKITDKGAESISATVNETYVDKVTEVIATALNITDNDISESKVEAADKIIKTLKNAKVDLKEFNKTNDLFISTLNSIKKLLVANKDMGPEIKSALAKAGAMGSNIKDSIKGFGAASPQITSSISEIINQGSGYAKDLDEQLNDAFDTLKTDSSAAADKLERIIEINNKIINVNNTIISVLNEIKAAFPNIKCDNLITRLNHLNKIQNNIIDKINTAADTIRKTGKLPKDVQNELKSLVGTAKSDISQVKTGFTDVKKKIDNATKDVYTALDDVSDFIATLSSGTDSIDKVLDSGIDTVDTLKATFKNLGDLLNNANKKIDTLIEKVKDIRDSKKIENFLSPIIANPAELGKFVSSPVTVKEHRLYHLENYGSAMTPFYSALGLWVGGVVLVAVVSVGFSKRQLKTLNNPKPHQLYFGRYLMFFAIGQFQALVIALGDLFFLKIQCDNPLMFIVASMISSFVYTLIIYSLTITFSVLGKALAVIILVLQVAGSGGTFPIEVLPGLFRAMSPFLPFKYGINAMREAVAGMNWGSYWSNIGYLMLFSLIALFIGLVLRKPCIKVISFFNNRVEESDVVI